MKKLLLIPLALAAALAAAFFLLRTPDTKPAEMIARYGGENARFADGPEGLKIHYRDEGNPDGQPIILLHGNSSSLHTWEPLVERLGGEFRIITYDQPGHGLTGPSASGDYSANGLVRALDAVAAAAGVDHFVLGGNSMGGWITWRYALERPERVDALILIDAAGAPLREGEEPPPSNLGFKIMRTPWLRPIAEHFTPRSIVEKSVLQTIADDAIVSDAMVDRYWELLRYPGNRHAAAMRAVVNREPEFAARLGEIAAPTLIIWGADDQLIYSTAAQTFAERLPNAEAVIYDGVGHLPMEEAADRISGDILRFLERLAPEVEDTMKVEHPQ